MSAPTIQHFFFIQFEAAVGRPPRAVPVRVPFRAHDVVAVWTLPRYVDAHVPPSRPFAPVHGQNAFLEDAMHDWTIRGHDLLYRSRLTDRGIWVLIETRSAAAPPSPARSTR